MTHNIGDQVLIVADNFGTEGVITAIREGDYPYLILTADGEETWYAEFEVFDR